jgi:uncharacterized protein YkwD
MLCAAAVSAQGKMDNKKEFKVSDDEQAVIDATNAERKAKKMPALKMNEKLMETARGHAANMAKQNTMAHELNGANVDKRADAAKYKYWRLGENVAYNWKDAKEALASWMDSKPHRENILNEKFTEIGVGAVKNEKGELYWCQVFGTPRK